MENPQSKLNAIHGSVPVCTYNVLQSLNYSAILCRVALPVWGGGLRARAGRGAGRADLPAKSIGLHVNKKLDDQLHNW